MKLLPIAISLVFSIQFATSLVVVDSTLASSCVYYLNTFDWGCHSHSTGMKLYKCRCGNVDWLGSVSNCVVQESNSTRLINHAFRHLVGRCKLKGNFDYTVEDFHNWYENATVYLEEPETKDFTETLKHPVKTNTSEWEYYHKSFKDFAFEVEKSQWFGWGLVFYWGGIMFVATLINLFGFNNNNFIKRHISLPSTFNKIKNNEQLYYLWNLIPLEFPTRLETIIVGFFVLQVMITCCVGYTLQLPNAFINNRWYMNLDLISYRTDMMSISLFPIIFLFGIRNNPFIPLTGISFATFNVYHKWTAIVMVVLAFIHSIIWTVDAIKDGGYEAWAMDLYWQYGIAATTIAVLLVFHSDKWLRDLLYEIFLVFHKLFNVFFIVTMYYHCNTLGWLGWIWSMAGILAFDRTIRWIRILLSGGLQDTKMIRCDNDVIKLVLNKPKLVNYTAGSYAFIYFMSPWYYCWQSHPFTIISSPIADENGKLIVYFKPHKGITKKLLHRLINSEEQELNIKVLVEGPYGTSLKPIISHKQEKVVGFAGGLGIVSIFPHFVSALENTIEINEYDVDTKTSCDTEELSSTNTQETFAESKYQIYWVINNLSNMNWFQRELQWLLKHNCSVHVLFTGLNQEEKESFTELQYLIKDSQINVFKKNSRPDFGEYLSKEFQISCKNGCDLDIIACGPSSFNDDLRYSLVQLLKQKSNSKTKINYHVESFTW